MEMLVLFFCLLSLTPAATEVGLDGRVLVFPDDTGSVLFTPEKPLNVSAFTLCVRFAVEIQDERRVMLFSYRTPDVDELSVWIEKGRRLSLYIQSSSSGALFSMPSLSDFQTHLCFTWDSATGLSAVWVDGRRSLYNVHQKGRSIRPSGTILLGRDPNLNVVSSDTNKRLVRSETADLKMWDYVLTASQIKAVYSNPDVYVNGNVFDWRTIKYEITGNVIVAKEDYKCVSD